MDFKQELKRVLNNQGCEIGIVSKIILNLPERTQKKLLKNVVENLDYRDIKLPNGDIIEMSFLNYDTVDLIYTDSESYIELCGQESYENVDKL